MGKSCSRGMKRRGTNSTEVREKKRCNVRQDRKLHRAGPPLRAPHESSRRSFTCSYELTRVTHKARSVKDLAAAAKNYLSIRYLPTSGCDRPPELMRLLPVTLESQHIA